MTQKWEKFATREGVDLTTLTKIDEVFYEMIERFTGKRAEAFFSYFQNKQFTHYLRVDLNELGRFVYKKYLNSPLQIKKCWRGGKKISLDLNKATTYWGTLLRKKDTKENLLSAFVEFNKQFDVVNRVYSIIPFLGLEIWQKDFEDVMNGLIERNNLENESAKIIFSVSRPWEKTALIKIQDELSHGARADDLVKKYQFLRSWVLVWHGEITSKWVQGLKKDKTVQDENEYDLKKLIKILHPNTEEKKWLEIAPYMVFFKDWRDDLRRQFCYKWNFLFVALAKYFKLEYSDLGYLTLYEIAEGLKIGRVEKKKIEIRKNHSCAVTIKNKKSLVMKVVEYKNLKKYQKIVEALQDNIEKTTLKGLVAFGGLVRGRVVVVNNYEDSKKVSLGDILVANTTHPNYLSAMYKAVAFVTNEGGLICHAAIVAREMKKPCIVGTKIATKIFKDGDLVEVDANRGIVKRV